MLEFRIASFVGRFDLTAVIGSIDLSGTPSLADQQRRREATSLRWEEVDFKTKSFKVLYTKNRKSLELPCSDYMMEILKRRIRESDLGPFELDEPKKFVAWVRKKFSIEFTVHDLRRSFITYAESLDFGAYTIKALVNHSVGSSRDVTEGYLQLSIERLRDPIQRIENYVLGYSLPAANRITQISSKEKKRNVESPFPNK